MATFKYIIPYIKEDGTSNVRIQMLHNRKKKVWSTNIILEKKDVTAGGRIKNQRVVDNLEDLISSYRKKCNKLGVSINAMSVDELYTYIQEDDADNFKLDLFEYMISLSNNRKVNTAKLYKNTRASLIKYFGDKKDINSISRIDVKGWVKSLEGKVSASTIRRYVACLKACYNFAYSKFNDEDCGIVRIKRNPATGLELPKLKEPRKKSLDVDVIRKIYDINEGSCKRPLLDTENDRLIFARDMFFLSFFLVGMNAADLYECKAMDKDGYIEYNRKKTRDCRYDNAYIKIKVPEIALPIIEKYSGKKYGLLLNVSRFYNTPNRFDAVICKAFEKLSKYMQLYITMYSARHSWATIAYNECGIDKYLVHESLNHVDKSIAITDVYIKKDFSKIDKANEKVIRHTLKL